MSTWTNTPWRGSCDGAPELSNPFRRIRSGQSAKTVSSRRPVPNCGRSPKRVSTDGRPTGCVSSSIGPSLCPFLTTIASHPTTTIAIAAARYPGIQAALLAAVAEHHRERVLELGCGTGHWLAQLAAAGCDVAGLDASQEMLRRAAVRVTGDLRHGRAEMTRQRHVRRWRQCHDRAGQPRQVVPRPGSGHLHRARPGSDLNAWQPKA